jgi:hypothetical protein
MSTEDEDVCEVIRTLLREAVLTHRAVAKTGMRRSNVGN